MHSKRPAALLFASITTLMGCNVTPPPPVPQQTPSTTSPAAAAGSAPVAPIATATPSIAPALPNADYVIEVTSNGKAPLKDGVYEEAIPNSSSKTIVRLGPDAAYGDLDGNHTEDAVVTLLAGSGGSGGFTYVAAVLNEDGTAKPVASAFIGDRITIKAVQIVDGKIGVTWLDRKPGEPMSTAPSTEVTKTFAVQNGKLVASDTTTSKPLRGHYTWGAEVETFQPCGSKQTFWVVGDKALLQPLRDKSAELSRVKGQPYQPVYIEASGVSEGKATDGFAMDYDAVYRFDAVQVIEDVSPPDCKAGG